MVRWPTGTRERLEAAAWELFTERGYEQTTVTDIAERAGLDKRTFYRQFGDKREVLFGRGGELEDVVVAAAQERAGDPPFEVAVAALRHAAGKMFTGRLESARARQVIIAATPELQERELLKLGSLARALTGALGGPAAALAAESGVTVFRQAYARWLADGTPALAELIDEVAAELRTVVG